MTKYALETSYGRPGKFIEGCGVFQYEHPVCTFQVRKFIMYVATYVNITSLLYRYITHTYTYILYSLKLSGTKIFVDFVVFEVPTKILSLKISYKLPSPTNLHCMRFTMVH